MKIGNVVIEGLTGDLNPKHYGGNVSRMATVTSGNVDDGVVTIAATESPAIVIDWDRYEAIREVLPMRYLELPSPNKVPLLDTHSRYSVELIKGSAKDFVVMGTELQCKTFVSKSEPKIREKIQEGHIDSVSIGYATKSGYSVEVPIGSNVTIDGVRYENTFTDGLPYVVRTWWGLRELSLTALGADRDAKLKRESQDELKIMVDKLNALELEVRELKQKNGLSYQEARLRTIKHL